MVVYTDCRQREDSVFSFKTKLLQSLAKASLKAEYLDL